ncbi:hypothetical protein SAMN04488541_10322 [Thermoflexibacter ruber]|uniref:Uncharacterized protein n=1 Tax=Thermoflexibacter ruber TaxID=1003 RepID=A0A1I2IHK9_9BACT|nr:hypothetical protein SAMN04488541_10322 [Thermoflexibacter ruber]
MLIDIFQFKYGYWESKDIEDDFERKLAQKIKIGYPTDNLLFENSQKVMLIRSDERETCPMSDAKALKAILEKFVSFERQEAKDFRYALEVFKETVPQIAGVLY